MALAERYRLRSPGSFSQVYRRGRKAYGRCLVARAMLPNVMSADKGAMPLAGASANASDSARAQAEIMPTVPKRVPERGDFALSSTRFGISISRKVSKKAVVRNRIKRQIRAALIALMPQVRSGYWVVITVRSVAISCEYDDFLRELKKVLTTLEVLHGD
ncbi:MAG: ribonuclease P protein component [Cyanobacteria bacterium J06632_22]